MPQWVQPTNRRQHDRRVVLVEGAGAAGDGGKGAAAAELLTVSMFILWLVYFAYA